jgi:hypothetical protein
MLPDRVVACMKNKIRGKQIFHPDGLVEACNRINSVCAERIDPEDNNIFRSGWGGLLSKYFAKMPAGFTGCYFYKFEDGQCTYRHLTTTPDADAIVHPLCIAANAPDIRTAFALELFGSSDKAEWSVAAVKLPRVPPVTLKGTKQISLSKKYFSIPPKYRYYYPSLTQDQLDTLSIEVSGTPSIAET